MIKKKFLGKKVTDTVTGLTGIATARIEYMNGCVQYEIQAQVVKDGVPSERRWFDFNQIKLVGKEKKVVEKTTKPTGGPPPTSTPARSRNQI